LKIQSSKMFIREQNLSTPEVENPAIVSKEDYKSFIKEATTLKLYDSKEQLLAEQELDVTVDVSPERIEFIDGEHAFSMFNVPFFFNDRIQQNIRFESENDVKDPRKQSKSGNVGKNSINLQFGFRELTTRTEHYNLMDILESLGGIAASLILTIGNISVFFVLMYLVDLVGLIYSGYQRSFSKSMVDHCLSNIDKIGKVILVIKELKENKGDENSILKGSVGYINDMKVLDDFTSQELSNDLNLFEKLRNYKVQNKRQKSAQDELDYDSDDSNEDELG